MKKIETQYPLQFLTGIGPQRAIALAKEGIKDFNDLVYYFPKSYIDKNSNLSFKELKEFLTKKNYIIGKDSANISEMVNVKKEFSFIGRIIDKKELSLRNGRKLLTLTISDGSGSNVKINFWNFTDYYKQKYNLGNTIYFSGSPELKSFFPEFSHPDIEMVDEETSAYFLNNTLIPKYKISESLAKSGITSKLLNSIIKNSLSKVNLNEILSEKLILKNNLENKKNAIFNLHFPQNTNDINKSIFRLKYEEIFFFLLKLNFKNAIINFSENSPQIKNRSQRARLLYDNLPFQLTKSQKITLKEIDKDFKSKKSMKRLLQGDVGSGKTIVAFLSILMVIDSGYQCCFIAPTEILAEQHFINFNKFSELLNIKIALITSSTKIAERKVNLEKIKSGEINLIIGTHSLLQKQLVYNKLTFVVIDEQHKFGVLQRAEILNLARLSFENTNYTPHLLIMSATPIPRTLSMTLYGDLDVSILNEKPAGRSPIITTIVFESKINDVYEFIKKEIQNGRQIYFVFPLVNESEKLALKSVTEEFTLLSQTTFRGIKSAMIHGGLKIEEKESIMKDFSKGITKILFATTVIEVGIDVPNASIMVIMNSERFGLSSLHQLRGRVGRGKYQSYCILITQDKWEFKFKSKSYENEQIAAIYRLKSMEETSDGFEIAERDLKLRGPGDLLGKNQSGLPNFRFLDLIRDYDIIYKAKNDIKELINDDKNLEKLENSKIKSYLEKLLNEKDFLNIA